ncbi:MAG: PKD domain-containing protein [Bacteroidota bacterium]
MNFKPAIGILIISFLHLIALGQPETYTIKKASFSSDKYDELAPVYYSNGIIFCTNRDLNLFNYSSALDKRLFKINFIDTTGEVKWENSRLFSKSLTTKLNDGPVTFNTGRDTIYYSRNLEVSSSLREINSTRNKLGIFCAVLVGKEWTKTRELRINNEWYNLTTPSLSPDGKRLFFASDKPGGFGGSDIYYSQFKEGYWNDPVNLGPVINTKGNEVYPYINQAGELFFSSDGHPGLGKKDIFFSRFSGEDWLTPIHLDAPINSEYDDFGIVTDSLMNEGYFSSKRDSSFDIYHFRTNFPQTFYSTVQKENQYCFIFSDSGSIVIDTLDLKYVWDFGNKKKKYGAVVNNCFPGPGKFNVKLDIVERSNGKLFFSKLAYLLDLRDFEQPYINSPDVSIKGKAIDFDGLKSYLPGYEILNFSWDFGDSTRIQGEKVKHSFNRKGEYLVNLELTLKTDLTGKIIKTGSSKKILVFNDLKEKSAFLVRNSSSNADLPDIRKFKNSTINSIYSAEDEYIQDAVFQVEILSSRERIDSNSVIFSKVPDKYVIEEIFNSEAGTYSYIIDQQMRLMDTYNAYKEIEDAGFKDVRTKIEVLKDPAAKELNRLKKLFGTSTDSYFDSYNRLTANGYLLLDQIQKILNKYPEIRIEVGVHTDNTGLPADKLIISEKYAQTITNYLISKGIDSGRLIAKGFGGYRPVASNFIEEVRILNRRLDFSIIKN